MAVKKLVIDTQLQLENKTPANLQFLESNQGVSRGDQNEINQSGNFCYRLQK